jgi:anthranilate/para-aminobenzoate synthase component I
MSVERYSHVMHIVSQVEGRLKKGATSVDALAALFPGGTITGCPKIKSIQIIEDVEKEARDIFYGSAGYFCGNGDSQFNILIRTALVKNKQIYLQAGAGIVADSQPGRELKEIQAKAKALLTTVSRIKLGGSK